MIRASSKPAERAAAKLISCKKPGPTGARCDLKTGHRGRHFHKFADGESVAWTERKEDPK